MRNTAKPRPLKIVYQLHELKLTAHHLDKALEMTEDMSADFDAVIDELTHLTAKQKKTPDATLTTRGLTETQSYLLRDILDKTKP